MRPTGCPSAVISKKTLGKDILVANVRKNCLNDVFNARLDVVFNSNNWRLVLTRMEWNVSNDCLKAKLFNALHIGRIAHWLIFRKQFSDNLLNLFSGNYFCDDFQTYFYLKIYFLVFNFLATLSVTIFIARTIWWLSTAYVFIRCGCDTQLH